MQQTSASYWRTL